MNKYLDAFVNAFKGTVDWTWKSIIFEVPMYTNYFWGFNNYLGCCLVVRNSLPLEKRTINNQKRFLVRCFLYVL